MWLGQEPGAGGHWVRNLALSHLVAKGKREAKQLLRTVASVGVSARFLHRFHSKISYTSLYPLSLPPHRLIPIFP